MSRSIPLARPIITWSAPRTPSFGRISRASARKRRFMRLRITAFPIFLVTVMPSRIVKSASPRSRTSRTNPPFAVRLAELAARKSLRALILVRRKASCDRVNGGRGSLLVRLLLPSGRESRDAGRVLGCSAEKCASSLMSSNVLNKKGRQQFGDLLVAQLGNHGVKVNCQAIEFAKNRECDNLRA
jgi:hypothetical protein